MQISTTLKGRTAEERALSYLKKHGLAPLRRNFRSRHGEIDLIMLDSDILVFVEVRSRDNTSMLDPLESIDEIKMSKIISCSEYFLQKEKKWSNSYCRFDVVTISGSQSEEKIEWIKNAFNA